MKLYKAHNGTWILKHRPYFTLCFALIILGMIPSTITSGNQNSLLAAFLYLLFGLMCLWCFADFSTLEISESSICYKRNLLLYQKTISKDRSSLVAVTLDVSPSSRSNSNRIKFSFADESSIAIPNAYVGSTIGWTMQGVYQSLRDILPELKQDSSDEILSLLAEGHKMQAIALVRRQYGMGLSEAKAFVDDLKPNKGIQSDPRSSGR